MSPILVLHRILSLDEDDCRGNNIIVAISVSLIIVLMEIAVLYLGKIIGMSSLYECNGVVMPLLLLAVMSRGSNKMYLI